MKPVRLACVATVALLALAACSEGEAKAAANKALASAEKAVESVEWSKLSPEALGQKAQGVVDELGTQIAAVKDSQTAKDLVTRFQPAVDQLANLGTSLANTKIDLTSIKTAVDDLVGRFKDNPEVMGVLQPLIDKLKALFA